MFQICLACGGKKEERFKRLGGIYADKREDISNYPLYSYPKRIIDLFLLDRLLTRICKRKKLSIGRKIFLRRYVYNSGNVSLIPSFVGSKISPHFQHTIYKNGEAYFRVFQYNGWLELEYVEEAREIAIECYLVLKDQQTKPTKEL